MPDNHTLTGKPLDPTTDAENVIGDSTGKTGVTTNATNEKGFATDGEDLDKTHLPGGVITKSANGYKKDPADPDQNPNVPQALSGPAALRATDIATEPDQFDPDRKKSPSVSGIQQHNPRLDLDSEPDIDNSQLIPTPSPDEEDEQSAAGSAPDPDADNDVGEMREQMTGVPDDMEHPEELNTAAMIDKAEEAVHQ